MDKDFLTLKRASASRSSGEWSDDDYDVLCEGEVVGRIMKAAAAPVGTPWMWTLVLYHEGRTPTHGYEPTREAAMTAFAKSWRRESAPAAPLARLLVRSTAAWVGGGTRQRGALGGAPYGFPDASRKRWWGSVQPR
jgi:hypothetical protein